MAEETRKQKFKDGLVGVIWYAVIILDDYTIHMWPGESKVEAESIVQRVRDKHGAKVIDGYTIKRDMDNKKYKNGRRV